MRHRGPQVEFRHHISRAVNITEGRLPNVVAQTFTSFVRTVYPNAAKLPALESGNPVQNGSGTPYFMTDYSDMDGDHLML